MLPTTRPTITEEEIAAVVECLRSGQLASGPRTEAFEAALAIRLQARHVLATNTGTAALHLAVLAAGVLPGDEVVTTPMTWVSTANVILHAGAKPIFADVEPGTLNLDPVSVEKMVTPRTKAILPVHYAGQPCDMDALQEIASAHDITVVEDAAHALGGSYKGTPIGAISDLTMFSFHPAKNMTTAEGGAVATQSDEKAERIRRLRYHGLAKGTGDRVAGTGIATYEAIEPGFKYSMGDLQATLGLLQLERLDERNARRRDLAQLYRERLAPVRHVEPLRDVPYEHEHAWYMMVVSVDCDALGLDRDGVVYALRDAGVGAGVHFVPLHLQALYRPMVADPAMLSAATDANGRILSLPFFPEMTEHDVDFVVDTLEKTLAQHAR